jgi:hypothetical protein
MNAHEDCNVNDSVIRSPFESLDAAAGLENKRRSRGAGTVLERDTVTRRYLSTCSAGPESTARDMELEDFVFELSSNEIQVVVR